MRKPVKMITNLRMQNIMEIRKENNLFRDQNHVFNFVFFGALGVESPHGGAIMQPRIVSGHGLVRKTTYFVTKSFFHKCLTICHLPTLTSHRPSPIFQCAHFDTQAAARHGTPAMYLYICICIHTLRFARGGFLRLSAGACDHPL